MAKQSRKGLIDSLFQNGLSKDKLRDYLKKDGSFDLISIYDDFDENKRHQIRRILLELLHELEFGKSSHDNVRRELVLAIGKYFERSEIAPVLTALNLMFSRYLQEINRKNAPVQKKAAKSPAPKNMDQTIYSKRPYI